MLRLLFCPYLPERVERLSGNSLCGSNGAFFGRPKRQKGAISHRSAGSRSHEMEPVRSFQTVSRDCLVNGGTLPKRCILAMTRSAKWARTALSETCRVIFGAYRGFAKQSLETVWKLAARV